MAHAIRMPKPGQMTEECVLVAWHKREGETVRRGDVLFEIETDKSNMDVESFEEGVLLRRLVAEGETVPVNAICGYVGGAGEEIPDERAADLADLADLAADSADLAADSAAGVGAVVEIAPPTPPAAPRRPISYPPAIQSPSGPGVSTLPSGGRAGRLRISPRATRLATGTGLDPRTIAGSGPGGRITERDVRAAIEAGVLAAGGDATGEEESYPLSRMRRVIASRLTASWTSTPQFTITVAVDMTRLVALRAELKAAGTTLSVTDFVLAAAAQSLVEFPDVNSRTDGVTAWRRRRVHLGLAVSVPGGLVVPVIRDADRLTVGGIHDRAAALTKAARDGTLAPDDMAGGTFTVSNLGMFDVDEFSAIVNPGESAILAVASTVATPMVVGGGIAVRQMMKLTLSADHRMVDGETGARFLNGIRRRLEDGASFRNEALNA